MLIHAFEDYLCWTENFALLIYQNLFVSLTNGQRNY